MFTSGEKSFNIFDIFFIIILLLSINQIILSVILMNEVNSSLKHSIKELVEDTSISTIESISFQYKYAQNESKPRYIPSESNLGFAGELILDCYSGYCTKEIKRTRSICGGEQDEDENYECEYENYTYHDNVMDNLCSYECFESKGSKCYNCPSEYISKEGICSKKYNDSYIPGKYCTSDNIIHFWKGFKYQDVSYNYTYLNNVKLKNEECPSNTKNCGIIDDNENKLCISQKSHCPINTISEEKLDKTDSSFTVGNKTFYCGYDDDKNKKIIAGLYVDTDLYLNKKDKNNIILDTYTISGLLEENKILYRGVDLGFDPYKDKNIDKKGKSYLKIRYNENIDLISLRQNTNSVKNKKKQDKIKKVKKNFDDFIAAGIVGFVFLIIFFVFLMIRGCFNMTKYNAKISKNQRSFLCCFIPSIIIFFIYSIIPIIKCCTAVGIFNEIGKEEDINNLKIINIMFIIFSFLLYAVIILLFVIFCIKRKRKDLDDINSVTNTSETNINTQNN